MLQEQGFPLPGDAGREEHLASLDRRLREVWKLGRNLILGWCLDGDGLLVLAMPYYQILARPEVVSRSMLGQRLTTERFHDICGTLDCAPERIHFAWPAGQERHDWESIESLLRRYSISYAKGRAVILFDIVGFSLLDAREQITQLSSLAYSMNSAHERLLQKGIRVKVSRSTTGDGFYVWNREDSIQSNTNLYHFMHLTLADNAIARLKDTIKSVPLLKTAFLIGSYYNIFQTEGLSPTLYNYVVGSSTIELARIIEAALPGQILVGSFKTQLPLSAQPGAPMVDVDSVDFIEKLQSTLSTLQGVALSGEQIGRILCYLTGDQLGDTFTINRRRITDKHGLSREVYNAKVNIYRQGADPIYLGLQEKELAAVEHQEKV